MKFIKLLAPIFIFILFFTNVNAASASFYTSGGGNVVTNQTVSVVVSVNSSSSYNAVSLNVNFNNLTYLSASASSNWTPVSGPSRNGNSVSFSGAVLGNSYTGSRSVLTLSFRTPSTEGSSTVSSSGTIALADGNGTQVNGSQSTATYKVSTPPPAPKPSPNAVNVSSTTHPNQNAWYKQKDVTLTWVKQDGVTQFSYQLDQKSDTTPDDNSEGLDTSKTFTNLPDGTSYFHIKAKNDVGWSSVSHFTINVDSISPDPFSITKVDDKKNGGTLIYFSTKDSLSGIDKYGVKIDGVDKGYLDSPFKPDLNSNAVVITAYDKAGNSTESTLNLKQNAQISVTSTTQNPANQSNLSTKSSLDIPLIISSILLIISIIYSGVISYLNFFKKKGKIN